MLKGAGSIAITLPWLEIMEHVCRARAQSTSKPANRFVAVFQPGGTVRGKSNNGVDRWVPTAINSETSFTLRPILAPFEGVRQNILIADGFDMNSAVGEQHQAGSIAFLSGTTQANNGSGYATGPSIDQVLSKRLSTDKNKKQPSVQLAVRWATGKSHGNLSPINCVNFEQQSPWSPIPPSLDPQSIFKDLFGSLSGGAGGVQNAGAEGKRQKSILDYLDKRYAALAQKLGGADRRRLDEHLNKIRELETSLAVTITANDRCRAPSAVDTSGVVATPSSMTGMS